MKVFEIFKSISGEVGGCPQGSLATFIRFSGCNMKPFCSFCDAEKTQSKKNGMEISLQSIIDTVNDHNLKNIIITGGEPLIQDKTDLCILVANLYHDHNKNVTIETNGTLPVPGYLSNNAVIVMDYKLDSDNQMREGAFRSLTKNDFIKFVIKDTNYLKEAIIIQKYFIENQVKAQFAYSPMMPKMTDIMKDPNHIIKTQKLAKMITYELMKNKLQGIINIQMHKILNLA